VIFQAHGLVDTLSARQNVLAGTFGRRSTWDSVRCIVAPSAAERSAVDAVLERVGLGDRARDRAFDLSGGHRQRVAIARSIIQEAPLVLADEPAASLDPALAKQIVDLLLADARARGATLVCTLHQPELTRDFDRVVTLVGGRIADEPAFDI
jgi:phosphonate transport system ATP-binding protein